MSPAAEPHEQSIGDLVPRARDMSAFWEGARDFTDALGSSDLLDIQDSEVR